MISKTAPTTPYFDFAPITLQSGFEMKDYWIWCGSPIKDEAGTYHLFASRWPKTLSFSPYWLTHSEIVRAESPTPEGPYTFKEVILTAHDPAKWDGRMAHNPSICKWKNEYLLFYTGTTYEGPTPTPEDSSCTGDLGDPSQTPNLDQRIIQAHSNQRVGVAKAPHPSGPWQRPDSPIISPRPGKWDSLITTNPAPCVLPDGTLKVIYKSVRYRGDLMRFGIVESKNPTGPFERVIDGPLFSFDDSNDDLEDPFFWFADNHFHLIAKDMEGGLSGVPRAGIYWKSIDGINWDRQHIRTGYLRTVQDENRQNIELAYMERPSLLLDRGKPTHFFTATADGNGHVSEIQNTRNTVIKIRGLVD